jgi:hypothetical protein
MNRFMAKLRAKARINRKMICSALVATSILQTGNNSIAAEPAQTMELPAEIRAWYRNPDGSCVQCSIGMCGVWSNVPAASTLLWNTEYGPAERRGSWPSRVSEYAASRGLKLYNVTGETTLVWLRWAARTGRFAAMAAGNAHFQTLYGIDPERGAWQVCNNNSPHAIDDYTEAEFKRLHARGGAWIVVLDTPAVPPVPKYEE